MCLLGFILLFLDRHFGLYDIRISSSCSRIEEHHFTRKLSPKFWSGMTCVEMLLGIRRIVREDLQINVCLYIFPMKILMQNPSRDAPLVLAPLSRGVFPSDTYPRSSY